MRVKVAASGAYTYPDVVVVRGEPEFEDEHVDTLLNPTLLVEVLSPSTEVNDRVRNWQQYRRIPSLAEYVLVAQDQRRVEWYARQQGGLWTLAEAADTDVLVLQSVGCRLALDDVYERAV
jgi:Uma2 family endonuclease